MVFSYRIVYTYKCFVLFAKNIVLFNIRVFIDCNWVVTRWQQYSTHLHTNNTQNDTINNFSWKAFCHSSPEPEECRPCPVFASYTLAFVLPLRKKARKRIYIVVSRGVHTYFYFINTL